MGAALKRQKQNKTKQKTVSHRGSVESNLTSIHEDAGLILGLTQWAVSCGLGHRRGSDLTMLWLWCRPADIAPIQPLA